jgi:DNA-binding transcriptional MerR regulator
MRVRPAISLASRHACTRGGRSSNSWMPESAASTAHRPPPMSSKRPQDLDLALEFRVYPHDVNGLKISELADRAGVNVSTVRFYERIGLVPDPVRSTSGYRLYDPEAQSRLMFIARGRRLGLSLEQIADLLVVWDGTNCGATREKIVALLDINLVDVRARIVELQAFADQLEAARSRLAEADGPSVCDADLTCCAPVQLMEVRNR